MEFRVSDFSLRVRLQITPQGFRRAGEQGEPALRIVAPSTSSPRLLLGDKDPNRPFFEQALVMEGDTELGLVLKNTPDALGPPWPTLAQVAGGRGAR